MDRVKFERMIHEFPFLLNIFQQAELSRHWIQSIQVKRADSNLLEAQPRTSYVDAGSFATISYRKFWVVCPFQTVCLKIAHYKERVYEGGGYTEEAGLIGDQLMQFAGGEITHLVEIMDERFEFEDEPHASPKVIIYRMSDFAWQRFCPTKQTAQS